MALLTDRKFIHFNRKSDFEALLNANAISDKQIVFLKDAQEIWTHGTYYGSVEQFLDETNKDSTNAISAAAVYQALADDEEVIAAALNDLNDKYTNLDSSKQDVISDLDTIRENAQSGASKVSNVQADWDAESGLAQILHKPDLSVYENEVTSVNGQTGDVTIDIPSKISDLTDDLSLATLDYVDDKLDDVLGISADGVEAFVNMTRDEDTATGILTEIVNKAPKTNAVNGAPLSNTESYFYGTSTTAAATVLKEVSIPSITSLKTGQIIVVKPTITSTVANSTIKLNNFTAYPMRYNNAAITTSTDSIVWAANIPSIWVFDGTYWVFLGHGLDSNTTYSAMTQAEATTGTSTTARTISAKVLHDTIEESIPLPLIIEVNDTDTTVPSGTYASIGTALTEGRRVIVKYTIASGDGDSFYLPLVWDASTPDLEYDFGGAYANTIYSVLIASNDTFVGSNSLLLPLSLKSNHTHGNIQSGGTLQTTDISIANGDKLVVTDSSDSSKIARASVSFDGSTTTKALTPKGTWETFLQNHQSIKSLNTNNTSAQTVNASEAIAGTGTINLHKVSKTGSYSDLIKPSGGIPKTDLASAVQTSLGKADTSVQNKGSESNIVVGVGNNSNISITSSNIGMETENSAILVGNDITLNTSGVVNYNGSRVATATDLQGKQDVIRDLQTIRDGAADGATAIQGVKVNGTALTPDANKAVDVSVPTKTSDLTNDSGFLTSYTETDPTVLSWAKNTIDFLNSVDEPSSGTKLIFDSNTFKNSTAGTNIFVSLKTDGNSIINGVLDETSDTYPWNNSSLHVLATNRFLRPIIDAKAPSQSPTFTGTPKAPTAATGTNTTLIATTAFVQQELLANGGEENVIETVKVNGTALTPDSNKAVNITIPEGELSTNYEPSSLDNEDLELAAGDTYEEAFGKLEKSINDNEQITAAALTDLDSRINTLHLPQSLDDIPDGSTRKLSDYATTTLLATKQDALVSGTNIKTINNESILGSGNITIQGGSGGGDTNVIETVKVNGTALTPDANKAVDITVPITLLETNAVIAGPADANYISDVTNIGSYVIINTGLNNTKMTGYLEVNKTYLYLTWQGKSYSRSKSASDTSFSSAWEPIEQPGGTIQTNNNTITLLLIDPTTKLETTLNIPLDPILNPVYPGSLNTTATTALSTNSSESLAGNITLHKVAKTGTYSDLIGKPTIPAAQVQSDWNATSGMGVILNKPTIPTVNNATLTIQKNGTTVNTFTANASSNVTANIQVNELPTVSSSDNGKVLQVVNGAWSLVTPTAIYSGTSAPDSNTGNNGDIYLQTS